MQTRRLPSCQLEIPAIKVKTVALIGPDKFLANIFALFLHPNSFFFYNPDDPPRSGSETDLTLRQDPASPRSRYLEVNLSAKKLSTRNQAFETYIL